MSRVVQGPSSTPLYGRRSTDRPGDSGRLAPTVARWPLETDSGFERSHPSDPCVAIVHGSIADYRSGRADRASARWHDGIRWRVPVEGPGGGEWTGPDAIFELHRDLARRTNGTYRQRLIALEGSHGPFVQAHVHTRASRAGRTLDMPSLIVFELAGDRISSVTELPGDRAAWRAFWED